MYYVYVLIFTTLYVKIMGIGIDLINKKCEFFVFIYKIYCSYVFLLSYFLCFILCCVILSDGEKEWLEISIEI